MTAVIVSLVAVFRVGCVTDVIVRLVAVFTVGVCESSNC